MRAKMNIYIFVGTRLFYKGNSFLYYGNLINRQLLTIEIFHTLKKLCFHVITIFPHYLTIYTSCLYTLLIKTMWYIRSFRKIFRIVTGA